MTVRVGLLGAQVDDRSPGELRAFMASAEAAGLDHIAVGDHVSFYAGFGMDGLVRAAQYFGASERIGVNTAVYLLPLRHPVLVARQLAELGAMAPGRFVFGVGVGGEDRHEVEMCGVDPRSRGRRMDECVTIVRRLLEGEPVDHHGEFFDLERAWILPAPETPIPIVVGGRSDAAIRRAGTLGDGWFGIWVSPRRYGEVIDQLNAHAADAGRGDVPWTNALNVWCGVADDRATARGLVAPRMEAFFQLPFERFEKWSPYGTADDLADFLEPYVDAGCQVFNLILQAGSAGAAIEAAAAVRERLGQRASR
jgi:alkanesulfonate monooxygenase SsuD/methylene tetrahydromethanopterin reductase-like flavin-dependent oxidoreductase (luciferase family)